MKNMHQKKWIGMIGALVFVVLVGASIYKNKIENFRAQRIFNYIESQGIISPTTFPQISPDPFADLTIPYLRQRNYESKLGGMDQIAETSSYISYLTSYDSDGLRVEGLLTEPKGEMPDGGWPAIVFVHGYIPPTQYRTTTNYNSYVDYLAKNGFVVFKIDLRGHAQSEGEPGGGYYSGDYVIDTLNARAALQLTDFVKPDAIGLWGHSMAGNVIYRAFTARPEIPAIVIWAGAVYTYDDMQQFGIDDNSYRPPARATTTQSRRQKLRELHGDFDPSSDFWQQVAPTNYLSDLTGAIQINHAVDDAVVSVEYSRNLMRLLDTTSIIHELHEYPSGGHNMTESSFTSAMQKTVEFYIEHLK